MLVFKSKSRTNTHKRNKQSSTRIFSTKI